MSRPEAAPPRPAAPDSPERPTSHPCALPLLWKLLLCFALYCGCELLLLSVGGPAGQLLCVLLRLGLLCVLCWWWSCFSRLSEGAQALAAGILDRPIDTTHMPDTLRRHGEALNNISAGLSAALEQRLRSERFRAELVTNVSHDLKTPLTSIISYVDLLRSTQQPDPKAQEYIAVLAQKSQRLKKLTEDLVEASKASAGVLPVERDRLSMNRLLEQALGEWQEKLEAKQLTVLLQLPEGEVWVYADGRHLWRVMDNLLSNCAKYAMSGTRVYLELTRAHGLMECTVKNISQTPLTRPPEQLSERFVRGDVSRSGEGSGLGLSIVRSLVELQGGQFHLTLDGDLFKADFTLPLCN